MKSSFNWKAIYYGPCKRSEIRIAIKDKAWQATRESMKNSSLQFKYVTCCNYIAVQKQAFIEGKISYDAWRLAQVRVTNYITALSRGGLIKRSDYL